MGTSAGASVGAALASGHDLEQLVAAQSVPDPNELPASASEEVMAAWYGAFTGGGSDPLQVGLAMGRIGRSIPSRCREPWRAVVWARLVTTDWPAVLQVTTLDADTGELHVFDACCGVPFVDAVVASGAVPGVGPLERFAGRYWIDGGWCRLPTPTLPAAITGSRSSRPCPTGTAPSPAQPRTSCWNRTVFFVSSSSTTSAPCTRPPMSAMLTVENNTPPALKPRSRRAKFFRSFTDRFSSTCSGTVTIIDGNGFTRAVQESPTTSYRTSGATGLPADVKVGRFIRVQGNVDANGTTLDASKIAVGTGKRPARTSAGGGLASSGTAGSSSAPGRTANRRGRRWPGGPQRRSDPGSSRTGPPPQVRPKSRCVRGTPSTAGRAIAWALLRHHAF